MQNRVYVICMYGWYVWMVRVFRREKKSSPRARLKGIRFFSRNKKLIRPVTMALKTLFQT